MSLWGRRHSLIHLTLSRSEKLTVCDSQTLLPMNFFGLLLRRGYIQKGKAEFL